MRRMTVLDLCLCVIVAAVLSPALARAMQPIQCVIRIPEPHTHYLQVELTVPSPPPDSVDLKMPVWIPGSYLVREFERHVERFEALDEGGNPLPWRKVRKNTWRIDAADATAIRARYWVYAFENNVRTSYVDAERAFLNPSSVVMFVAGQLDRPYVLKLEVPKNWKVASSGLQRISGSEFVFQAADYDELVDCPIEVGNHHVVRFDVDSVPHEIAISGRGPFDPDTLVQRIRPIILEAKKIFGEFPYQRYVFLVHLSERGGGGLEHRNSCALMLDRFALDPEGSLSGFLSLVAHEFFHAWNVKAIRPAPLGPFDYDRENYTTLLWLAEGFTTYYSGQIKLRIGMTKPESYLNSLASQIAQYEVYPGKDVQSLAMASFDAWIKYYRRDENFVNSGRSYYGDGALFATILDLEIRHRTGGSKSLDDVMRTLYYEFAKNDRWVTFEDFVEVCNRASGSDMTDLFRYVTTTEPMDFATALSYAGLLLEASERKDEIYTGFRTRSQGDRVIVAEVRKGSPAWRAGIYARDELIAADGYRLSSSNLERILRQYEPGDTVRFLVATQGLLREVSIVLDANPMRKLAIRKLDRPDELQKRVYEGWLHTRWE